MEMEEGNVDSVGDPERLGRSFERHLRAEDKSPKTVTTYGESVTQLQTYLAGEGITSITEVRREHLEGFMADLPGRRSAATASVRFRALQQFSRWLVDDEHVDTDPMAKMRAPSSPSSRSPYSQRPTSRHFWRRAGPGPLRTGGTRRSSAPWRTPGLAGVSCSEWRARTSISMS